MNPLLPAQALIDGDVPLLPQIAPCDHYAGSEKLMRKSLELQSEMGSVFDITFDLEDGAARGSEELMHKQVVELINSKENQFSKVGLRIHDLSSPWWRKDIEQILPKLQKPLSHLTIPKAHSAAELATAIKFLRKYAKPLPPIHVLIETHGAIHEAWEIAALPEIRALEFGIMDFISSHQGAIPSSAICSPGQFDHALVHRAKVAIASAALAHGKIPVHNVTTAYNNTAQTKLDAVRAKDEFGFLRMWSIHPSQIKPILEAFTPSQAEVETASAVLDAGISASWGPVSVGSTLHDRASYRLYWHLLRRAHNLGLPIREEISQRLGLTNA